MQMDSEENSTVSSDAHLRKQLNFKPTLLDAHLRKQLNFKPTLLKFGAMHFIYYINRSIATKVDSTYLGY